MVILPQMVLAVIFQYWPLVASVVQQVHLQYYLSKYRQHWLVRLSQVIDLRPLEQGCAAFHQGSGRGSAVTHPVPRLVRALLLRHLSNLSLRQTEEQIELNLLSRWFVGYSWLENPPDHSTLCRFELWVLRHQPRLFFDTVLEQILDLYPQERERLLIADTFGMFVRGAKTYHLELLRDLCRHLLQALQQHDPQRYETSLAQLNQAALFGAKEDKITPALSRPERALRLQQVVNQALRLHAHLDQSLRQAPFLPGEAEAELRLWLAAIDKVITDETTLDPDPQKPGSFLVTERPHGKKGQYRHACANDLSGTYRDHGRGQPPQIQHNSSILASPYFIHETEVVTGATPDPVPLPGMLEQLPQHHGYFPPKVAADQIYGSGKCRALVDQVSGGQSQLIALLPDYEKRTDRFVPADFILLDDGQGLTCPAGKTTGQRVRKAGADGDEYRFPAKLCQGCRFWPTPEQLAQNPTMPHCRKPDCKPNSFRDVFISDPRPYVLAAQAYNKTEQFKLEIRQRPLIERIIFNLTHFFGARHAKSTGLDKANFQLRMASTAFNLRQLLRRRGHKPTKFKAEAPLLPLPEATLA
jgi:hypothetical protein